MKIKLAKNMLYTKHSKSKTLRDYFLLIFKKFVYSNNNEKKYLFFYIKKTNSSIV